MPQLVPINTRKDIFPKYLDTPIGDLLEYQNFNRPFDKVYSHAEILVGMCMDSRKRLNTPEKFAYVIRTGGGNLRYSEFKVSYTVAVGGVRAIALIGHNNCGMVNIMSKEKNFINGLVDVGWNLKAAEDHFHHFAPLFEIGNEIDFLMAETKRIRARYPKVLVAPIMYQVEDNRLYLLDEDR